MIVLWALLCLLRLLLGTDYPRKDQWGRPKIVPRGGTEEVAHTRVTTVAKTLDAGEALVVWRQVMTAGGAHLRPDILAKIGARWPERWPPEPKTKAEIEGFTEELKEAAAASAGSNLGDAEHTVVARLLRGEKVRLLPPMDCDVAAIMGVIEDWKLETSPELVERTVVLPQYTVAGSFDFLVHRRGRWFVCDLKTGQKLDHSWQSIAIQLALYSRAATLYDWSLGIHEPMPEVDQRQGLVLHAPAGSGHAELHVVDLEAGWEAAQHAFWARAWRARKDLARPARHEGRG